MLVKAHNSKGFFRYWSRYLGYNFVRESDKQVFTKSQLWDTCSNGDLFTPVKFIPQGGWTESAGDHFSAVNEFTAAHKIAKPNMKPQTKDKITGFP